MDPTPVDIDHDALAWVLKSIMVNIHKSGVHDNVNITVKPNDHLTLSTQGLTSESGVYGHQILTSEGDHRSESRRPII